VWDMDFFKIEKLTLYQINDLNSLVLENVKVNFGFKSILVIEEDNNKFEIFIENIVNTAVIGKKMYIWKGKG
jgi:hypothetical protein